MSDKYLDYAFQLAAGALAGGVVKTPEDAVEFADDCYDRIARLGKSLDDLEEMYQANGL